MLLAFIAISYLSIPGAIGIFPANAYSILLQRFIASTILLIIVIYYGTREFLSSIFTITFRAVKWIRIVIIMAILTVPLMYAQSNLDSRRIEVFRISWTYSLIMIYFLCSGIYFLLFELTLRGIFLSWLTKTYSPPLAVSFNVLVYAYMHLPKSLVEAVVCVPFGLLLCIATIRTRSILRLC
jgi:membrane protease YdiL (CAAX protease family)